MKSEANKTLMREILDEYVRFYTDEDNPSKVYVEYPCYNGATALESVDSKMFNAFLGHQYREESDEMIAPDFSELLEIQVQNLSYRQNNTIRVHRRVAGSISSGKVAYFLADAASGTEMELVIDMELCMGLRRGELLGLEWGDVDWDHNQIKIIRNRVVVNGKSVVKEPKTATSVRTLDVPLPLMKKLKKHKMQCLSNKLRLGPAYTVTDYIIVHPDGKPIYPEYLSQMLTKLQNKAGLPKCRFHDLRHLCASIMLLQGVNVKVAQERLGHKDITTTMNIYSHVLPSSAKEAADKIGELVYKRNAV